MLTMTHAVAGTETHIYVPESPADLAKFRQWIDAHRSSIIAVDTETMHLNTYADDFRVRTVQFGTAGEAWVIVTDNGSTFRAAARYALGHSEQRLVCHNAPFDLLALSVTGLADLEALQLRTFDTYILAHLLDARSSGEDGAPGHGLKALAEIYVCPDATDGRSELLSLFRSLGRTKDTGWSHPELIQYETYLRYAGLDVIYTAGLFAALTPIIRGMGLSELAHKEHRIQDITTRMTARGVLIDVDYVQKLRQRLADDQEQHEKAAARFGVSNVNSPAQVAAGLTAMGVNLTAKTPSGALSVGKDVVLPLAGLTGYWSPIEGFDQSKANPLAAAVANAKRARKWGDSYAQAFLDLRDKDNRLHANIRSLAARTARMSVSHPPLQQIPSGWEIRRSFVADDGHTMVSSDFSQIELRVIAANAGVANMIDAISNGIDLHDRTADLIWGAGHWDKRQRGIGKNVAFAYAYGGGPSRIAITASIALEEAKSVRDAYENAYPELLKYSRKQQQIASRNGWKVTTPTGRQLHLSRERTYAALNYITQSTARDLFADALLRLTDAGHDSNLLLPIHDEIISQYPTEGIADRAVEVTKLMTTVFQGVPIDAGSDILTGGSWGSHPDFKIPPAEDYRTGGQ